MNKKYLSLFISLTSLLLSGSSFAYTRSARMDIIGREGEIGIFRYRNASKSSINSAVNFASRSANYNLGYDWGAIFSGGLLRNRICSKYICSEHTWASYNQVGLSISQRDLLVTPGDIGRSLNLNRIDYYNYQTFNQYTGYNYLGWKNSIGLDLNLGSYNF